MSKTIVFSARKPRILRLLLLKVIEKRRKILGLRAEKRLSSTSDNPLGGGSIARVVKVVYAITLKVRQDLSWALVSHSLEA